MTHVLEEIVPVLAEILELRLVAAQADLALAVVVDQDLVLEVLAALVEELEVAVSVADGWVGREAMDPV